VFREQRPDALAVAAGGVGVVHGRGIYDSCLHPSIDP
jgi:hypothetical protein